LPETTDGAGTWPAVGSRAGADSWFTWIAPLPAGQPLTTGGGGAVADRTTPVGADSAAVVAPLDVASTRTRSVLPWSTASRTYVRSVAPEIAAQLAPFSSPRCHW
jgi:hypothetical protein